MVGAFNTRNLVGTQVTLGKILVWMAGDQSRDSLPVVPGRASKGRCVSAPGRWFSSGLGGGFFAGAVVGLAVMVVEALGVDVVRGVLIAVSPEYSSRFSRSTVLPRQGSCCSWCSVLASGWPGRVYGSCRRSRGV